MNRAVIVVYRGKEASVRTCAELRNILLEAGVVEDIERIEIVQLDEKEMMQAIVAKALVCTPRANIPSEEEMVAQSYAYIVNKFKKFINNEEAFKAQLGWTLYLNSQTHTNSELLHNVVVLCTHRGANIKVDGKELPYDLYKAVKEVYENVKKYV